MIGTSSPVVVHSGLSFHPASGTLWASVRSPIIGRDKIYTINITNGQATEIGGTGFGTITPSIAFDASETLFGITGLGAITNNLITINEATGAGTLVGSTGLTGLHAIALRTDSTVTNVASASVIPASYWLDQNYPNPFNPKTTIRIGLPTTTHVTLTVYDILGKEVARLLDGVVEAGYHAVEWGARNKEGSPVSSGLYVYKLEAANRSQVLAKKMMLVR